MDLGETFQLRAWPQPVRATNRAVTWTSQDPSVASVSPDGLVTGNSVGETDIEAKTVEGHFRLSCRIIVEQLQDIAVKDVFINTYQREMAIGETFQLAAWPQPPRARNRRVSWSSSAPEIAEVSETGLVTAHHLGSATVTATTEEGGFTASCQIVVQLVIQAEVCNAGIRLSWVPDDTCGQYHVFRRSPGSDEFEVIGTAGSEWIDDNVVPGSSYTYFAERERDDIDQDQESRSHSDGRETQAVYRLTMPGNLGAEVTEYGERGIRVFWDPVVGADYYCVFRGIRRKQWQCIGITCATEYYDLDLRPDRNYFYTVCASVGELPEFARPYSPEDIPELAEEEEEEDDDRNEENAEEQENPFETRDTAGDGPFDREGCPIFFSLAEPYCSLTAGPGGVDVTLRYMTCGGFWYIYRRQEDGEWALLRAVRAGEFREAPDQESGKPPVSTFIYRDGSVKSGKVYQYLVHVSSRKGNYSSTFRPEIHQIDYRK